MTTGMVTIVAQVATTVGPERPMMSSICMGRVGCKSVKNQASVTSSQDGSHEIRWRQCTQTLYPICFPRTRGKVEKRTRLENKPQALREFLGCLPKPAHLVIEADHRWQPFYEVNDAPKRDSENEGRLARKGGPINVGPTLDSLFHG
jgi:hypothetical protein